jgi:Protein of unknown function (DUF3606)
MPDNLNERAPQDASRISLSEDWEVRYWTKAFGVSREELERLVREHGNSADTVKKALHRVA